MPVFSKTRCKLFFCSRYKPYNLTSLRTKLFQRKFELNDFQNLDYIYFLYYINFRSTILLGVRKDGVTLKIGSLNMNMPVSIDTAQHDPSIEIVN